MKALLKRAMLPENPVEATIFLSYARQDAAQVGELYDKLCSAGFTPWMDTKNIHGGERWETAIRRAIRGADFFVVCLSPRSTNKRGFMQTEIKVALEILVEMLDEDIYLIPARLEACDVEHERLCEHHWVDLFADYGFERLVHAIREGAKRRR